MEIHPFAWPSVSGEMQYDVTLDYFGKKSSCPSSTRSVHDEITTRPVLRDNTSLKSAFFRFRALVPYKRDQP